MIAGASIAFGQGEAPPQPDPEIQARLQEMISNRPDSTEVIHPSHMTPLTPDAEFPRFTADELRRGGYPDHLHAFFWLDWTPLVDDDGRTYGPATLCKAFKLVPRDGLEVESGRIRYANIDIVFNPEYLTCDIMPFVEVCDLGRIWCRDLLGLERSDTLHVINPDNTDAYRAQSGNGVWRTFKLAGDTCIVEPVPILNGRTLIGHSGVELMVRWNLQGAVAKALPAWFQHGIANYIADNGAHLNNYMAQFRIHGDDVLLGPARADSILAAPPSSDDEVDRRLFRMASYAAFLMAWNLVENHGGLEALRQFIHGVAQGENPETVCRRVYGMDSKKLVQALDPRRTGEPVGKAVYPTSPHAPPKKKG
jgi:hypothetical protein